MKAKIKKTGEIVNLASYATITLDQCDSWGNPIELKPEEVELIPLQDHWQDVREHAAISALQGILANSSKLGNIDDITQFAVDCADALIEKLKN